MQERITSCHEAQRVFFATGVTKPVAFRVEKLRALRGWMKDNKARILDALHEDLGKSRKEALLTEWLLCDEEAATAIRKVHRWARPKRVTPSLLQTGATGRIHYEPYGVALILSPWNYPFLLTVAPLIGALSAGCCAILKPSADAPATAGLLAGMAKELFDPGHVDVIQGGRQEITGLLERPFDTIFFTGSPQVGRVVMRAAAEHLTPVSLELGGKSPCIVDATADIAQAAKRIAWGKYTNAGQTCVAPDYLLVHESVQDELIRQLKHFIRQFYGDSPLTNAAYPHIVNQRHFFRLSGLLEGANIQHGGGLDEAARRIEPTLCAPPDSHPLMAEEIFGPILPIFSFSSLDEAIKTIQARPKPLALYLFTKDRAAKRRVLNEVSFGGGCVNDALLHLASSRMPFGGVGESGMGRYHGHHSFLAFSHQKSVLTRRIDFPIRYPPYKD